VDAQPSKTSERANVRELHGFVHAQPSKTSILRRRLVHYSSTGRRSAE
jgi:hypothetical protein